MYLIIAICLIPVFILVMGFLGIRIFVYKKTAKKTPFRKISERGIKRIVPSPFRLYVKSKRAVE